MRDEVEIAHRANYDRDHGVPDALDANNPVQATELRRCMTKSSYSVPSTTKIMALLTTFTSSRRPMPRQLIRERSTTLKDRYGEPEREGE
jgi:hypothetical protein